KFTAISAVNCFLFEHHEGLRHFAGGMVVADFLSGGDAALVEVFGLFGFILLLARAAGHEVGRNVIGVAVDQFIEFSQGLVVLAELGVFHRDTVAEEGIVGLGVEQFEQLFQTGHEDSGYLYISWRLAEISRWADAGAKTTSTP